MAQFLPNVSGKELVDGHPAFDRLPAFGGEEFPQPTDQPLTNYEEKYLYEGRRRFRGSWKRNEVALEIIRWAGRELASLAIGVIRQLDLQQQLDLEVVQIGSLFDGSPLLGEVMLSTIRAVAPGARLVRLTVPPVIGGVLLGMEQAGIAYASRRQTLIETTGALWGAGD